MLKPVALSGSRGVMRADDPASLDAAVERLRRLLAAPDVRAERNEEHNIAVVEGFIPGREFAVEGVLDHGGLQILAIFDKPDPLNGPFFEETIYVTPSRVDLATRQAIVGAVGAAARAIGLYHGPIHAECRVNENGVFVLEVAARPIGGLCARALRFHRIDHESHGHESPPIPDPQALITLEELLLRHALGESVARWEREPAASGVMMIPIPRRGVFRGVDGIDAARAIDGVDDVRITAKAEQLLVPLPEGASYLGFIFARAGSPGEVEQALRSAHARLHFAIDAELPVVMYNHAHG